MESEVKYAGFMPRFAATILDWMWFLGVMYLLQTLLESVFQLDPGVWFWFVTIIQFIVVVVFWRYTQSTPGKMLFGIRIVDAETLGPVPTGRLALRYVGYFVSMVPLFLGIFWVAFDPRKQGWHDKIAKTVLVRR